MIEAQCDALDGTDSGNVGNITVRAEGRLRRQIFARMRHCKGNNYKDEKKYTKATSKPVSDLPRVKQYHTRMEPYTCPYPSMLASIDEFQEKDVPEAVTRILQQARDNGLPKYEWDRF